VKRWNLFLFLPLFIFCSAVNLSAGWKDTFNAATQKLQQTSLQDTEVGKAMKEALSVGIDKAVANAGKEGGYSANPAIRIRFPENLSLVEKGLRTIGMGPKIDDFEASVNKAAEESAPLAKDVLLNALVSMSIEDAKGLLSGGDTAATDYFRKETWAELHTAFKPRMKTALNQHGVSQKYDQLIGAYSKVPFAAKPAMVSSDEYAATKTLDGLFKLIAAEEKNIRQNPAARTTELLKSVFGKKT